MSWVKTPAELTWWQEKAKQNVSKIPVIKLNFGMAVRDRWLELQPGWRRENLSREIPANHSWLEYKVPGPCGYFLVIMCMSWWLPPVTDLDCGAFNTFAEDIT